MTGIEASLRPEGIRSRCQSLNRYAYVLNNPTTLTDPTGLFEDIPTGCHKEFVGAGSGEGTWKVVCNGPDTGGGVTVVSSPNPGNIGGTGSVSAGAGGGNSTPPPSTKPPTKTTAQRLACAAQFGSNHSIAAAFGAQNNFVANLFLGNTASSLASLGLFVSGNATPTPANFASIALKGAAQGIPVPPGNPGLSGAKGQLQGIAVQSAVSAGYNAIAGVGAEPIELGITATGTIATPVAQLSSEALGTIATGVGVAKFAFDATAFIVGFIGCSQ